MRRFLKCPSPAMIVALIALFVAMGGSVYAAGKFSGKTIKKGSEPGNRLKTNSVTGKQVNESTLGAVKNATNADKATTASDASALGGKNPNQVVMWAAIDLNGNVARSTPGVTSQALSGTGNRRVTFPIDVSNCAYQATGGALSKGDDPTSLTDAIVVVEPAASSGNAIVFKTVNQDGAPLSTQPAFITVTC